MSVYAVFTRNKKIGSRLIAAASNRLLDGRLARTPSHCGILIDEGVNIYVLDSTLTAGVRYIDIADFVKENEILYTVRLKITPEEVYKAIPDLKGKGYDWLGLAYFAAKIASHLLFKTKIPNDNKWESDKKYFCNELLGEVIKYPRYSMVTPAKMMVDLIERKYPWI